MAVGIVVAGFAPGATASAAARTRVVPFTAPAIVRAARTMGAGVHLELRAVALGGETSPATLDLERFSILADDAQIVIHDGAGEHPARPPIPVYLRGTLRGEPGARVVLSVHPSGEIRGILANGSRLWMLAAPPPAAGRKATPLAWVAVDPTRLPPEKREAFGCEAELLPATPAEPAPILPAPPATGDKVAPTYTARLALETDVEYWNLFGNAPDAVAYALDLLAYSSGIYVQEIATNLLVGSVSLWSTASDPWTQTSSSCSLYELGRFWNYNRTGVTRTIVHFLSGRGTGGGVAWLSVLCSGAFSVDLDPDDGGPIPRACPSLTPEVDLYGGGYGFTGSLTGAFDPGSPTAIWDIVAVSHEIGHNFSSPHTHCYAGIGGNASPVDKCYVTENGGGGDSCNAGTGTWNLRPACACDPSNIPALPSNGSLTGGAPGAGDGTIMSYCHLLGGNFGNITLTFGQSHLPGVAASRVSTQMASYVASQAALNPTCLGWGFESNFETGGTQPPWSATLP